MDLVRTANISMLFTEVPLLDRPARARAAGFEHIESWWPFGSSSPSQAEVDDFVGAILDAGVVLTGVNMFSGDAAAGERGVACRPERRTEFEQCLPVIASIAGNTGCRLFNCLYGQYDTDLPQAAQDAAAIATIAAAAEYVADLDGTLLLEPLTRGRNGAYPLATGDDIVALITGPLAALDNVALLFDLFHLGSNGVDLVAAATRLQPWIGHVQVADAPERHEPGTGSLPIRATLQALVDAGYSGYVGCEYHPASTTEEGLGWWDSWMPQREQEGLHQ